MPDPTLTRDTGSFAVRMGIKGLAVVAAIAIVVALVQRTGIAPLPHRFDDFLAGFAVGICIVLIVSVIMDRR